ncbi:hypothetical protein CAAN1_13S02476 [[Candida] anglica]|uniref:Hap4 transcription factor heteromerisation domain-containing protein n=1 Tax=[Candida] anglica TaxID=148631 RepID=A0ABP0EIZ8_9ASCO
MPTQTQLSQSSNPNPSPSPCSNPSAAVDSSVPMLAVKTSKAWVLPPRPKPGRKPTTSCKEKKRRAKSIATETSARPGGSTSPANLGSSPGPSPGVYSGPASTNKVNANTTQAAIGGSLATNGSAIGLPVSSSSSTTPSASTLSRHITTIEAENSSLKTHLLSLIQEYTHLRSVVLTDTSMAGNSDHGNLLHQSAASTRKRSFTDFLASDPMNELIDNMSDLSHSTPGATSGHPYLYSTDSEELKSPEDIDEDEELFNFINLEDTSGELQEQPANAHGLRSDDDIDFDMDSPALSRTTSPSETDCENSLMTSLTRSTTVSTNNSSFMLHDHHHSHNLHHPHQKKSYGGQMFKDQPYNFYSLPQFDSVDDQYGFTFDHKLSAQEKYTSMLKEDQYNSVTDFLEERLIANDMNYYVQNRHDL